jgi:hypothetical protein
MRVFLYPEGDQPEDHSRQPLMVSCLNHHVW